MLLFFCNLQCHFMPLQRELYVSIQVSLLVIKYTGSATWLLTGRDGVVSDGSCWPQFRSKADIMCNDWRTYNTFGDGSFATAGARLRKLFPTGSIARDLSYREFKRLQKALLEEVEDSSRTKRCGFGLGLGLEASIFLLSIVFTVAVRVTRTVQGSRFTRLTLRSQLCEERWLNVED